MSTIIVGVDAGSYSFSVSGKQITISGIPGLSLAAIKMVQNLTTGKLLHIFNGPPATFADGVLTLNAGVDLSGAQDTDLLAIYVAYAAPQVPAPISDGNAFPADLPLWNKTAQVTAFSAYAVDGPFAGTRGHRVTMTQNPGNNGIWYTVYSKDTRSAGIPLQLSCWFRSDDTVNAQLNLFVDYTDGSRDTYTNVLVMTPAWQRFTVEGYAKRHDAYSITAYLRTANGVPKTFDMFGPDLRVGSTGVIAYAAPAGSEYLAMRCDGCTSLAAWGDSLTANDWMKYLAKYFRGFQYYNGGVGGENAAAIRARAVDPANAGYNQYGVVTIWAGRNDIGDNTDENAVLADIGLMVKAIPHGRWLVLDIPNATDDTAGAKTHADSLCTKLAAAYGERCVPIRSLYNAGNSGIPRPEFVVDNIHMTEAFKGVVAGEVYKAIKANGWA